MLQQQPLAVIPLSLSTRCCEARMFKARLGHPDTTLILLLAPRDKKLKKKKKTKKKKKKSKNPTLQPSPPLFQFTHRALIQEGFLYGQSAPFPLTTRPGHFLPTSLHTSVDAWIASM
jgi:hypothetical protein